MPKHGGSAKPKIGGTTRPMVKPGVKLPLGKKKIVPRKTRTSGLPSRLPRLGAPGVKPSAVKTQSADLLGRRHAMPVGNSTSVAAMNRARALNLQRQLQIGARGGVVSPRRFNDWQFWFADYYGYRQNAWYGGQWGGRWYDNWGVRWNRRWRRNPGVIVLGITPWGMNRMAYWSGCRQYTNPYCDGPTQVGDGEVDYREPMAEPNTTPSGTDGEEGKKQPQQGDDTGSGETGVPPAATAAFERARTAFQKSDYKTALKETDAALKFVPQDAVMHEFRALILFATGDYKTAAATLNSVLSVGPGWDWKTMRGLYSNVAEYTKHLRALEKHADDNPKEGYPRFLLGYHYLCCGHKDAAQRSFKEAVALAPTDSVSKQLLNMLSGEGTDGELPPQPGKTDSGQGKKDVDPGKTDDKPAPAVTDIQGTWTSKRNNETFQLVLGKDNRFTWTHTAGAKKTEIKGVYALNASSLALEPDAGGVMLSTVELKGKDLLFKLVDADEKEPGITFTR